MEGCEDYCKHQPPPTNMPHPYSQMSFTPLYHHKPCLLWAVLMLLLATASAQCPNEIECGCETNDNQEIIINCRREGLTEVPTFDDTSSVFAELTLFSNSITSLPANAFKTTNGQALNIRRLDLGKNRITSIDNNAFAGLEDNLKELILHTNGMTTFPTQAVQSLTKLEYLSIEEFSMASLPSNALSSFSKLQVLYIESCELTSLSSGDLTTQQNTLRELHLPNNKLSAIPKQAASSLTSLTKLDMPRNLISALPNNAFQGIDSLQELVLSQNGLNSIMPNAFQGLERTLVKLSLSYTNYHDSTLQALSGLNNLEILDLNNNNQISTPSFDGLASLRHLNLHGCGIETLSSNMFRELGSSLEELDLVSNGLSTINDGAFGPLTSLKTLHLDGNPLSNTLSSGNKFSGLEGTLEYLSLDGTQLTTNSIDSIHYLAKLKTLKLNSNAISSIPFGTFTNLNQLQTLEMNTNQLKGVTQRALRGLHHNLQEINLGSNSIASLDECVFYEFDKLTTVKLANNPVHCDCNIRWLCEWSADSSHELDGECTLPAQHSGKDITDVAADDFTCDALPAGVVCETYTSPTQPPTTTTPTPSSTLGPVEPVLVNITSIASESFLVYWTIPSAKYITGFHLMVELMETGDLVQEHDYGPVTRQATVYGLDASTQYMVCVLVMYGQNAHDLDHKSCQEVTTEPVAPPVTGEDEQLALILGCVIGILGFIVLVGIIIFCIRRCHRNKLYEESKLPIRKEMPQMGYNSKRFSKPKSVSSLQNMTSMDLEKKLEGFSQEERDRILNLLTSSGASTLSMISNASSNRYLDEPLPHSAGYRGGASNYPPIQYLNPVGVGSRDSGYYHEIPADQIGQYEYIPADQIGKYDYIPADKVARIDISEPVPPTPVPRPEGELPPLWGEGDFVGTAVRTKSDVNLAENAGAESWI